MLKVLAAIAPLAFLLGCNAQAKAFPTVIADEVEITLTRTACFGNCPALCGGEIAPLSNSFT